MSDEFDLLHYLEDSFRGDEVITVAGQESKITSLSKAFDTRDALTLTIEIRPMRQVSK